MGIRGRPHRAYRYVGPAGPLSLVRPGGRGCGIRSVADFEQWVSALPAQELAEPFTFVVDTAGVLRLAPRRSEHVVCAGGAAVLAAGEMGFSRPSGVWAVGEVSNQSTGYCPDVRSWQAVADALDAVGLGHPGGFTYAVVFRRCPGCRELSIVREEDFVCVFCEGPLPDRWNVDDARGAIPAGPGEA
ncbi:MULTISPECIES: hypothetical protein [unclassified Streptomyces]|uniref:hypothetical protein n=1 Tax=Streptomyces TaxID=1883 RepID=UPI0006AE7F4A|nr:MULTISPECIES: hypothetical protein [unclassified Streptomyces]KOU94044.1 hypothetical protein ADK92_23075 [Streptomyces sp. XY533]KOV11170.1 hypothetical protein ADK91_10615 [Streptomyces sp. XY511]QNE29042.1 hypothetical protein F1D59_33265 [Streptomyces sp. INR7]RST00326.1 hypothetical protein EF904_24280 [Streptomyces sp. WAC05950]